MKGKVSFQLEIIRLDEELRKVLLQSYQTFSSALLFSQAGRIEDSKEQKGFFFAPFPESVQWGAEQAFEFIKWYFSNFNGVEASQALEEIAQAADKRSEFFMMESESGPGSTDLRYSREDLTKRLSEEFDEMAKTIREVKSTYVKTIIKHGDEL